MSHGYQVTNSLLVSTLNLCRGSCSLFSRCCRCRSRSTLGFVATMYSTLFRELYASRIQLEMNSTETSKLMAASDVRAPSDGGHVTTPVAILDPQLESTNCQTYHVSFVQATNGASAMFQVPSGWGTILESFARNGTALSNSGVSPLPLALCLSGYLPQNEASQQQQQQLALNSYLGHLGNCSSQADPNNFGYGFGGHLVASCGGTLDPSIPQQSTIISHQSHLPDKSATLHRLKVDDNILGCLTAPSSSSSTSFPPSEVILSGASTVASPARCYESEAAAMMMKQQQQPEDDEDADAESAALNPEGNTPAASVGLRVSPHQQQQQQQPTRTHEPLMEPSDDEDDDDDVDEEEESRSRPRSSLGPFDRLRKCSLGAGDSDPVDGATAGVVGPAAAPTDRHPAPSQLRRSSIACIPLSSSSSKGPRGTASHRPSAAAALDYESLKVRLEKLTGPVTEGGAAKAADKGGRRTSLPVHAAHGLVSSGAVGGGPTLSSVDGPHGEDDQTMKGPTTTDAVDGASNQPQMKEGVAAAGQRPPSSSPSHAKDHLETDEKNPMDDLSSSNSLSSSSSSTSSSFLEKLRLQCVLEHVLQNDLRLQEIIKRHELEREYVRRKHRCQWMELEKSLTQNFGEAWKVFIDIPELSFLLASFGLTNHHENFAEAARHLHHHHHQQQLHHHHHHHHLQQQQQQQNRRGDDGSNAVPGSQNTVDAPLGTIREGQSEEGSSLVENEDELLDNETASFYRAHRLSLAVTADRARATGGLATVDERERRRNSEGNLEALHRKLRGGRQCSAVLRGQSNDDGEVEDETGEIRLSHNIANCLAKNQCIPCPGSSRLHRPYSAAAPGKDAMSLRTAGNITADSGDQRPLHLPQAGSQYPNYWLTNPNLLLAHQLYQQDLVRRLVMANLEAVQQMPFAGGGGGGGLDPGALTRADEDFAVAGETQHQRAAVLSAAADPIGCEQTWKCSQNPVEEAQVDRRPELQQHPHHSVPPFFQAPFVGILPNNPFPQTSIPAASRIGWTTIPEVGLTGFYPNPLLQNERLTFNPQEMGQQILAFPWTTTSRPNPVYSLSCLNDYGDPM